MIAMFPGKFQPPHIGHIMTIMKLCDRYDRIIVCITEDHPRIISVEETKHIFKTIFKHLPKVMITSISGVLRLRTTADYLPIFDVLVTGNPEIIKWANDHQVKCEFVERSNGPGFSGTEIRKIL